jgi:hypothetical protein
MAHRRFDVKPNQCVPAIYSFAWCPDCTSCCSIKPLARPKARKKQGEDRSQGSSTLGSSTAADSPCESLPKFKHPRSLPKIVADLLSTRSRLPAQTGKQGAKEEPWRQVLYHGKAISKPRPYHYPSPCFAHGSKPQPLHRGMGDRRESSLSEAGRRNWKDESDTMSTVASLHTDTTLIEDYQQERDWQEEKYWHEQEYRQEEDDCWWGKDEEVEEKGCTIPIYAIGDPSGLWRLDNEADEYDRVTLLAGNQRSSEFWF